MTTLDFRGDAITGANVKSASLFEQALAEFQCYVGDPVATIDRAIEESPEFVMAYCLKAYLCLCGTEAGLAPAAEACVGRAEALKTNTRERQHIAALRSLAHGELEIASERLEDILIEHPRDILALQAAHLFDFYRGDSRNLRDRVARVRYAWSSEDPGYHALLGMHAFGLEECGDYARAESTARRALEMNPRDSWAHHAVAHVYEMQGRVDRGIEWMRARESLWAEDNFFAIHNWWHWALYHLELDQYGEVINLYDRRIRGNGSQVILDLVDASAMLWRLHLRGVDVGQRWEEIAKAWAPHAQEGYYAFNDLHAMMAFVGANEWELADAVLQTMTRRLQQPGSNRAMTRDVGLPLARGFLAFGRGDYATTVELLRPIRAFAHRFGGSHAQRDVIDLTLIEAALRSRQMPLVRRLAAERLALKPTSRIAKRYGESAMPVRIAA